MNALNFKYLMIGLALLAAAAGGAALKPTKYIADQGQKVDLETMIPKQFADWKVDETIVPITVSPDVQAKLDTIYNQTLARTYINQKGERIMLSIAYGGDQSDSMQVHKPEVCYPAQGFEILKLVTGMFDTGFGHIPVKRLLATQGNRVEPIIYWITVGDTVAVNSLKWKLAQMKYGLTGKVPDGMIFRVSSLGDEVNAYPVQEDFIRVLLKAISPENRKRLIGSTTL
jgi:EpsI family protein